MSIDTGNRNADDAMRLPMGRAASSSPEAELITAVTKVAPRLDLGPLLAYLDTRFKPLMEKFRAKSASTDPLEAKTAESGTATPPAMLLDGPSEEDLRARDQFLAEQAGPADMPMISGPKPLPKGATKQPVRIGLGPPVFIGFDCEWQYAKKGKNWILSVQFWLVGPTGEQHTKVIDVDENSEVEVRPSLAEALDDLLDEAESYCVFHEWPCEIILCGFFTRSDITVFRDFKTFRHQLQGINGTLATVGKPASLQLPHNKARDDRLKSRYCYVLGDDFDPRMLSVRLVDASRLAPPGKSLFTLGDWLDMPKLKFPRGYHKGDMRKLKRERPDFFREYGLRDAEIAVVYVLWVLWFCDRHLGLKGLSATASGFGVRLVQVCMRRDGVHPDVALNFTYQQHWRWDKHTGRPLSKKKREPTAVRGWFEAFFADAYLGGRNECYWFGPTEMSLASPLLYDHDLAACYVVSLSGIMTLDYDRIEIVRDKERFKGHVAGYAQVRFKFPADTLYPCLPVTVGNYGLWFPLSGVALATAPEIELAMEMGAEIEILHGVIIPWMDRDEVYARSQKVLRKAKKPKGKAAKAIQLELEGDVFVPVQEMQFPPESHGDTGYRPFESFAIYTRSLRLKYKSKSLPNEFIKLVGNSCYGKVGQGFKDKRSYSPKEMDNVKIGPSSISEAADAALVSGFARAVLGEILWKLPEGTLVVSATTDGVLVGTEKLDLTGTMCQRFKSLVDRIAPGTGMTELKHLIHQAVAGKTRLQLTGKVVDGKAPVVAKGGVKVLLDSADGDETKEKYLLSPTGQNEYVLNLFVNRFPGQIIKRPSLMSMRDQLPNDWDLQIIDDKVMLNMEFDFKRRPVDARMVRIESHGVDHLAFSTVPWETTDQGELVRTLFDQWRVGDKDTPGHCLKTMEDWSAWKAYEALYVGNRQRARRFKALQDDTGVDTNVEGAALPSPSAGTAVSVTRGKSGVRYATRRTSYLGTAVRTFLAAYVQRAWGLAAVDLSQSQLACWLTEVGYSTKLHDVKNEGRSMLYEHVVPAVPEVMAFLAVVKARFPGLEVDRFLADV